MNRYIISLLSCILLFSSGLTELLYNPDDNVYQLDFATFETRLGEPTAGKLVKFFNGFCKESQDFMPAFRKLSRNLYKWRRILKVHVFDCSKDENNEICRSFRIRRTPTLRYFPMAYQRNPDDLGTEITSRNVKEIESELGLLLGKMKYFKMFTKEDNITDIFRDNAHVKYVAMVFQMCLSNFLPHFETGNSMEERFASIDDCNEANPVVSSIGRNTLLELLPYNEVVIRVFDDHEVYSKFGISPVPNLIVLLNRSIKPLFLTPEIDNSKAYAGAIRQFLVFADHKPHKPLPKTLPTNINEALRYEILEHHKHRRSHRVYRADLERAINQILKVELRRTSNFIGIKLSVLNNFLRLIYYLSPLKPEAKEKLYSLYSKTKIKTRLTGVSLEELVFKALRNYPFDGNHYIGCIASQPFLRGFSCSLWTLFHYLTVESNFKSGAVVQVFNAYVKFFMDCKDCVDKLKEFKKLRPLRNVRSHDQEVLWLWKLHNFINKQLAGDSTEDPQFPKIQFPSEKDCPNCRDNQSEWRTEEVLKYLKNIYSLKNLSWFGMASAKAYT
ncbi:sulfhydryl oxidase 2 [Drosophila takahashii]|uniref:sulfhydryl oxidase 2 n=1 Tax=Drosophila takahashii TaxID=29030 RepID=UPI001CF85AA5|nr:sulfhydryl oxidase 2 [Drosophila takahashii]